MPVASILGWTGVALGTCAFAAQAVRVRRQGSDGVSATTWSLFLFMSGFWFAYGLTTGSPSIVASTVLGAPVMAVLLGRLDPAARRRGIVHGAVAVALCAGAPALLVGWNAGLVGIGVLVLGTRLPQLRQLVGAQHAHGVSAGSWLVGTANVGVWLAYDVATARPGAALTMAAALGANVAIVALVLARHRAPRPATAIAAPRAPRRIPSSPSSIEPALA